MRDGTYTGTVSSSLICRTVSRYRNVRRSLTCGGSRQTSNANDRHLILRGNVDDDGSVTVSSILYGSFFIVFPFAYVPCEILFSTKGLHRRRNSVAYQLETGSRTMFAREIHVFD